MRSVGEKAENNEGTPRDAAAAGRRKAARLAVVSFVLFIPIVYALETWWPAAAGPVGALLMLTFAVSAILSWNTNRALYKKR